MVMQNKKRVMVSLDKNVADLFEDLAKSAGLNKSSLLTTWINQKGKELEQKK